MTRTVLQIDASARQTGSMSRALSARIVEKLSPAKIIRRDLADPLPLIDENWIAANFTPASDRDALQQDRLRLSDQLVAELRAADTVVIGLPVYNFSVPSGLKAWIDLVARAGETFRYTPEGPHGLLAGKRAILAVASGGTAVGSEIDFATPYMRHVLRFFGIEDIEIVAADQLAIDPDASKTAADSAIEALAA